MEDSEPPWTKLFPIPNSPEAQSMRPLIEPGSSWAFTASWHAYLLLSLRIKLKAVFYTAETHRCKLMKYELRSERGGTGPGQQGGKKVALKTAPSLLALGPGLRCFFRKGLDWNFADESVVSTHSQPLQSFAAL